MVVTHSTPTKIISPPPTVSALTTLAVDNSALLECFKTSFCEDSEWQEAVVQGNPDFTTESGLIFHKGQFFVPKPLCADILHSHHDQPSAGLQACNTCAHTKTSRHKPYGLLKPLEVPSHPWQAITMDFIVKLPVSHGYNSIWVVCDRLTCAAHFVPCHEAINAPELAYLFLDHIFRLHGLPDSIISNHGSVFASQFWKELTTLQISSDTSTAYHPQTDGLMECTNQTLEAYLQAYCSHQPDDWVDYSPLAEFVFNNLENASTKQTPFYANYEFIHLLTHRFPSDHPSWLLQT